MLYFWYESCIRVEAGLNESMDAFGPPNKSGICLMMYVEDSRIQPPLPHLSYKGHTSGKAAVSNFCLWQAIFCFVGVVVDGGILATLLQRMHQVGASPEIAKTAVFLGFVCLVALGAGAWFLKRWQRQQAN